MTEEHPKRRRWFQFRLRALLIVVLVLSLPLSWFAVRMERVRRQREAAEKIERAGGTVMYNWATGTDQIACVRAPAWLRDFLGIDFFRTPVFAALPSRDVCDVGLDQIQDWTKLEHLYRLNADVSDTELIALEGLRNLEDLYLGGTHVTDAGIMHLRGLARLNTLTLRDTEVSDAGLEHLMGLTSLNSVDLRDTNVTPDGVKKLQEALSNCKIEY